jgi:hypothetical protein
MFRASASSGPGNGQLDHGAGKALPAVNGVAVVFVQHVVQGSAEDPEGRLGHGRRSGVRVGHGHDRVGPTVDEGYRQVRSGLGESGGDLHPCGLDGEQRLPPEPALPSQRVVQQGVHVRGWVLIHSVGSPTSVSMAPVASSASIQSCGSSGAPESTSASRSSGERRARRLQRPRPRCPESGRAPPAQVFSVQQPADRTWLAMPYPLRAL